MEFSILLVLMTVLADDSPMAERSRPDAATCQLIVDGEYVEKLTLEGSNGRRYERA